MRRAQPVVRRQPYGPRVTPEDRLTERPGRVEFGLPGQIGAERITHDFADRTPFLFTTLAKRGF
jgi:hypothetical protein